MWLLHDDLLIDLTGAVIERQFLPDQLLITCSQGTFTITFHSNSRQWRRELTTPVYMFFEAVKAELKNGVTFLDLNKIWGVVRFEPSLSEPGCEMKWNYRAPASEQSLKDAMQRTKDRPVRQRLPGHSEDNPLFVEIVTEPLEVSIVNEKLGVTGTVAVHGEKGPGDYVWIGNDV